MRRILLSLFIVITNIFSAAIQSASGGTFLVDSDAAQVRLMLELRAQQFLNRATFGATDSEVAKLAEHMAKLGVEKACSEWIDTQFDLPTTYHTDTIRNFLAADGITNYGDTSKNPLRYRHHAWWHNAITAPDQLKQRLAWALIQICVVGEGGDNFNLVDVPLGYPNKPYWFGLSKYYDVLLNRCDDTYRDVLQDVTYHPMMGIWLSSFRNRKANPEIGTFPDENFAREILQLMSIGLFELNIDGTYKLDAEGQLQSTYSNETIQNFARVFTGFNYASGNNTSIYSGYVDYLEPMIMTQSEHDTGPKKLLNGQRIAWSRNGDSEITTALNNIYAHPNVAPFISRLLIQRLVRSNPSKAYITRVAKKFNDNGLGVRGDMRAVVKAILIDGEAWASIRMTRLRNPTRVVVSGEGTEYSRMVEPVVQYAGFFRRYGVPSAETGGRYYLNAAPGVWNQAPYGSPSVFNFYLPNHQPSGGLANAATSNNIPNGALYAPEFQILTSVVAVAWQNRTREDVLNEYIDQYLYTTGTINTFTRLTFDFSVEKNLADNQEALVEHLDKVLCNGTMTDDFRSRLSDTIASKVPVSTPPTSDELRDRMRGAMITVMNSPYYLIRY